jgi:ADP-heptose:LPS heptosyltransferase
VHGLKKKYKAASLDFIVYAPYAELLEGHDLIDEVIPLPLSDWQKNISTPGGIEKTLKEVNTLLAPLKRYGYDLVINRQFSRFEMYLTGAFQEANILGPYYAFDKDENEWLEKLLLCLSSNEPPLKSCVQVDARSAEHMKRMVRERKKYRKHLVDMSLDLDQIPDPGFCNLSLENENYQEADQILKKSASEEKVPILGVHAGFRPEIRGLQPRVLVQTLNDWRKRHKGKIVFLGTYTEKEAVQSLIRKMKEPGSALNLAGEIGLKTMAACLEKMDLLLSPESEILHLASVVDTPAVSYYYGSSYPWETAPYQKENLILFPELSCSPCKDHTKCLINQDCAALLTPQGLSNALDLAYDLTQLKGVPEKKECVRKWISAFGSHYRNRKIRVLHTGWTEISNPIFLDDLTKPVVIASGRHGTFRAQQAPVNAP